ncbi:MAG: hypothetical protein AABY10_00675 [Nanoarchaeota archaeon]
MSRAVKKKDLDGKNLLSKDELGVLRGTLIVLDAEQSEIANRLQIKEKGVYGLKFK